LPILIPDLIRYAADPGSLGAGDLLFFDLETTGLSGGAGTLAFLAAFGRFVKGDPLRGAQGEAPGRSPYRLRVDQYLLLDYPGEGDFLSALLPEFLGKAFNPPPAGPEAELPLPPGPPLTVTYNGKTFDIPLLRTRCLMNGMVPPDILQADLLHPARRLWKRILPGCSQAEVETAVLGLDRTGDTPGALAPDIWFAFLRTGECRELLGICDHNVRDIAGLARLFTALAFIAEEPLPARETYPYDLENLALHWRRSCGRPSSLQDRDSLAEAGRRLLVEAAREGHPRAVFALAGDLFRERQFAPAREYLAPMISGGYSDAIKAVACRMLAIDAEWRLRDLPAALAYTETALGLGDIPESLREDLFGRRERLLAGKGSPRRTP
jgi:uncharacterized protein YprB with RNaseH-like and TPR domain